MSPAAIASAMHQHIVFGTRPWEVGTQAKQRTTVNTSLKESAYPAKASTRDEALAPGFVRPLRGRNTSTGLPLKRALRIPTTTVADLEVLADDLEVYRMTTSSADALPRIYGRQSLRPRLLSILAHTQDATRAWAAYRALLILPRSPDKAAPKIPFPHRHRLLRLLAAAPPRPRNRGRFAQVLAVMRALHDAGGIVKTWEWNLLLDCAGKEGWRRPGEEHFRAALALLDEMRRGSGGGGGGGRTGLVRPAMTGGWRGDGGALALAPAPDIVSYTTLLAHAVRTRAPAAVRHAAQLLARAGLAPGVHAHTALLCFFAQRRDLAGVRDTLFRLRRQTEHTRPMHDGGSDDGVGLTQVTFNAVLWAFAYNGRLDVARAMYRVVRARTAEGRKSDNSEDGDEDEKERLAELEDALAEREMVVIAREVIPDAATYHTLIQAHAYQGDLRASLETLTDMLSASSLSSSPPGPFIASMTAYRAIFLGFARHGAPPSRPYDRYHHHPTTTTKADRHYRDHHDHDHINLGSFSHNDSRGGGGGCEWTLAALEALFARFLELPRETRLRESTLFWLVSAFAHTSAYDVALLRHVFERVEDRFASSALNLTCGYGSGGGVVAKRRGRLARIRERVFSLGNV
ncbi:hypothetical protein BJV74DRAFT_884808 [Russula compacta]|nr:hypothetical protein BJV74DRAFT_884808 [Russula compacta]